MSLKIKRGWGCFLGVLLAIGSGLPAAAYTPEHFKPFGGGHNSSADRSFVRHWEANPPRGYPTLSPANIGATKRAIKNFEAIVKAGGWKPIPEVKLYAGVSDPAVETLRARLIMTGELEGEGWSPQHYDYYVEKAVKRFQATNGLTPTGVVDKRTRAALNVSAKIRLKQLRKGLTRLRRYTSKTKKRRYVVVNVPAQQIEAVAGDKVISRHSGVVGKINRQTPILSSRIHEMNFNPIWRLPPTVVREDLIPKGRQMEKRGKSVLDKFGIDAYDGNGRKVKPSKIKWRSGQPYSLSYRQKPGKDNPLGFLKINFHNAHSVYMHDTPKPSLFGRNFRAASSGCIRVVNIEKLATWLLAGQGGWDQYAVEAVKESGERKDVRLKRPVALHFVYITAWATADGMVQFRRDVYRKDGVGKEASSY